MSQKEERTRSQLFREAIRSYVLRRAWWSKLFYYAQKQAKKLKIKVSDVERLISEYRLGKK